MINSYTIHVPDKRLLTHIMLYVVISTWIYHGKQLEGSNRFPARTRARVPMGIVAFPNFMFLPFLRPLAEKTYQVVHWTGMPPGRHFATREEPERLLADVHAFIAAFL